MQPSAARRIICRPRFGHQQIGVAQGNDRVDFGVQRRNLPQKRRHHLGRGQIMRRNAPGKLGCRQSDHGHAHPHYLFTNIPGGAGGWPPACGCGCGGAAPAPRAAAYFCSSVQIAVTYSVALGEQVGRNRPAARNSSGTTTSGAVFMSSGMKASDPAMPLA